MESSIEKKKWQRLALQFLCFFLSSINNKTLKLLRRNADSSRSVFIYSGMLYRFLGDTRIHRKSVVSRRALFSVKTYVVVIEEHLFLLWYDCNDTGSYSLVHVEDVVTLL
jgi:hypothetical protein